MQRLDMHHDPYEVWNVINDAHGELAFDVGTNIGQSTKLLATGFSRVLAFEPNPESFAILDAELPANVERFNVAVSSTDGTIKLDITTRSIETGQYVTGSKLHWGDLVEQVEVSSVTLDAMADLHGFPQFVKIDTEGHEVEVVKGGAKVFTHHPKLVIEVHDLKHEDPLRELLSDYEFVKVEHSTLRVASPIRENHFWLISR